MRYGALLSQLPKQSLSAQSLTGLCLALEHISQKYKEPLQLKLLEIIEAYVIHSASDRFLSFESNPLFQEKFGIETDDVEVNRRIEKLRALIRVLCSFEPSDPRVQKAEAENWKLITSADLQKWGLEERLGRIHRGATEGFVPIPPEKEPKKPGSARSRCNTTSTVLKTFRLLNPSDFDCWLNKKYNNMKKNVKETSSLSEKLTHLIDWYDLLQCSAKRKKVSFQELDKTMPESFASCLTDYLKSLELSISASELPSDIGFILKELRSLYFHSENPLSPSYKGIQKACLSILYKQIISACKNPSAQWTYGEITLDHFDFSSLKKEQREHLHYVCTLSRLLQGNTIAMYRRSNEMQKNFVSSQNDNLKRMAEAIGVTPGYQAPQLELSLIYPFQEDVTWIMGDPEVQGRWVIRPEALSKEESESFHRWCCEHSSTLRAIVNRCGVMD